MLLCIQTSKTHRRKRHRDAWMPSKVPVLHVRHEQQLQPGFTEKLPQSDVHKLQTNAHTLKGSLICAKGECWQVSEADLYTGPLICSEALMFQSCRPTFTQRCSDSCHNLTFTSCRRVLAQRKSLWFLLKAVKAVTRKSRRHGTEMTVRAYRRTAQTEKCTSLSAWELTR